MASVETDADTEEAQGPSLSSPVPRDSDTVPRALAEGMPGDDPLDKKLVKRALFPRRTTPVQIGRFQILSLVGRGGMGVVYAAYDDLLDRKVAVKVLLAESVRDPALSRSRLMREAQAMARLQHANIVTVHEVGQDDGQVFVAMEFVRGTTLDAWARQDRPWREIVATFVRAGRGLEAAHRAGLVHRDFKPANVMVGDDGAVKVLDFGLARAADDGAPQEPELPRHVHAAESHLAPLTRTGVVLGTPAYMSPEAHRGEPSTAAGDQFSFCVSLYQCLYRQPPFDTTSLATLLADLRRGKVAPPPAGTPVPARIFRALRRGLASAPADRFPSMTALLAELEHDPGATRRRLAILGSTAAATATAAFLAAGQGPEPAPCPDAQAELVGVWDPARAAAVRAALTAIDTPAAAEALASVPPQIERYAASWVEMRNEACVAHVEGRQSSQLFDLRTACLDQRRAGLDALVVALTQVDAAGVGAVVKATAELPPLARCADSEALTAAVPPPDEPRLRVAVQAHREALARAQVREDAAQYALGEALVADVLGDGSALTYEPLRAEALLQRGSLAMGAGRHDDAEAAFTEALLAGVGSGQDAVAAQASSKRAYLRAIPLNRPQAARTEIPLVTALNRRVAADVDLYAEFLNNMGAITFANRDLAATREYWEKAAALRERHGRGDTPKGIGTLANLGLLARQQHRHEDMVALFRRAAAASEALLGPRHPMHLRQAWLLADGQWRLGRPRQALAAMRSVEQRFDGLDNGYTRGMIRHGIALVELDEGLLPAAREHLDRALAELPEASMTFDAVLCERVRLFALMGDAAAMQREYERALARVPAPLDPAQTRYQWVLFAHGQALDALGRPAEALGPLEQVHAALVAEDNALEAAAVAVIVGEIRLKLGILDEAETDLRRARADLERLAPPRNLILTGAIVALAELSLARGRFAEAAELAAEALAVYEAVAEPDHLPALRARFARARALTGTAPQVPPEARALVDAAIAGWRGKSRETELRRASEWLAAHGAAPAL
ncbi:Serine/threonine protein kinase [Nannocystis exedens]|uniref:Serine/threonine protein kinase n=1 Tax=Nannocystis exedens TaxID=54 RepID=A0A1I2CV05_9BACT|nr:serine/threonine-protein kinase [Nannocystis exedens]PCC68598.1 serine/threonine protein kinase [Nannocystis exedens]SFE72098.1 Serine/threonine protein kinase [Nannocystis exedens]